MGRILRAGLVSGAAACCLLTVTVATTRAAGAAGAPPASASGSSWGIARPIPGLAALDGSLGAGPVSLSCPAAGDCTVVGDEGNGDAFAADEKAGTWRKAQTVAGIESSGTLSSVSCGAPGNCAADGYSGAGEAGGQAVIADEVKGTWRTAFAVPGTFYDSGPASEMDAMSCPAAGYCAAGGYTDEENGPADVTFAVVAEEKHGTWGSALIVPGSDTLNTGLGANVSSISCTSPGNCGAGGYFGVAPDALQLFVVTEKNGHWGTAIEVPGSAALNTGGLANIDSVSCAGPAFCAAVGYYADSSLHQQAFVVTESNGTWGTMREVAASLNVGNNAAVNSVSCSSPGNCAAVGSYWAKNSYPNGGNYLNQPFVITERDGVWQTPLELAGGLNKDGDATANAVSCPSNGNCAVGGSYTDAAGNQQAFLVIERNGVWQTARETATLIDKGGGASVIALSCPTVTSCVAAGYYTTAARVTEAFVVSGAIKQTTSTTLALSAASVSYGHEQSERITVTVAPRYAGTPVGTVKIRAGHVTLCVLTLASGMGSCHLTAKQLHPNTYSLTAAYAGGPGFLPSVSAPRALTVT